MAPLGSGRYVIMNCKHQNIAVLPDGNHHSTIVATCNRKNDPSEMWAVEKLLNGAYTIQNDGHQSFANAESGFWAKRGDSVVGGAHPQHWRIMEMQGYYCICPSTNLNVCWSLQDGELFSPIVLGFTPTALQNQWHFTRIDDRHLASPIRQSEPLPELWTSPSLAPTKDKTKLRALEDARKKAEEEERLAEELRQAEIERKARVEQLAEDRRKVEELQRTELQRTELQRKILEDELAPPPLTPVYPSSEYSAATKYEPLRNPGKAGRVKKLLFFMNKKRNMQEEAKQWATEATERWTYTAQGRLEEELLAKENPQSELLISACPPSASERPSSPPRGRDHDMPIPGWTETITSSPSSTVTDVPVVLPNARRGRASSPEPHTSTPISPRPTTERTPTADSGFSEGTGKKFFSHVDKSMTSINSSGVRSIVGDDIVIAIMGPTGTGKSSFINTATGWTLATVGHDLNSCTQDVYSITCPHPDGSGRNVVFVDTPGFDDSGNMSDYDVLKAIANWLKQTYKQHITLAGILLLHSIADAKMRGTPYRYLSMFKELCGADALQNVVLTTTMWNKVKKEVGLMREDQLQADFWEQMMSGGCRMARFDFTHESAWKIIDMFDINARRRLLIQEEMVDKRNNLAQTSAYGVLSRWWEQLITKLRGMLNMHDAPLEGSSNDDDFEEIVVGVDVDGDRSAVTERLELALKQQGGFNDKRSNHSSEVDTKAKFLRGGSIRKFKSRKGRKRTVATVGL